MSRIFSILAVLALVIVLAGCSSRLNGTRLEKFLGQDVDLVDLGADIGNRLIVLASPPLIPRSPGQPILVTTLVNNDNLKETTAFGRSLQNSIATEFVRQGYAVNEVRLRGNVLMTAGQGEFMLSRELMELQDRQRAQAVVVGTYSMANRVMYLSVRLVSPGSGLIRSAYEQRVYLDKNTLRMLGLEVLDDDPVPAPGESLLDRILY